MIGDIGVCPKCKAVYDLLHEESGDTYGYPVTFVRDEMDQWKIIDF
jgi:hypothetical protein